MNHSKDKILIVGGYGTVGAIVSKTLAARFPGKVIIAGRDKSCASAFIAVYNLDAIPDKIDLSSGSFDDINLEQIHTAISCIEHLQDDHFILACIKHRVHYTELATSYEAYLRLINYSEAVKKSQLCWISGVGLMPGLSGVFVQNAMVTMKKVRAVRSYVLLGLGENHGLDAIRWMLNYTDRTFTLNTEYGTQQVKSFADPVKERLLNEAHPRKFYRFDLGDQHIIKRNMNVGFAETRLAFDSRFVTWLIVMLRKVGWLKKLSRIDPEKIKKWLNSFQIGSEQFAVQTHCYGDLESEITYLAEGIKEAVATGIIASYAVTQLYQSNKMTGIRRLEEVVAFDDFIHYLQENQIKIKIRST